MATPLVASFGNRELLAAEPPPELNVVDFDVLRAPEGIRFAIAGSAHLCPAWDCWSAGHAGFVSVVDGNGQELASSDAWKQQAEREPPVPDARLLPRVVTFLGEVERPSLAAAYWWGTRSKNSACSRISACAGPVTLGAVDAGRLVGAPGGAAGLVGSVDPSQASLVGTTTFAQALGVLAAPGASIEHRQSCQLSKPLLALPTGQVASIVELRSNGQRVPRDSYSWLPGSRVVALSPRLARAAGRICVTYATSSRQRLAVADSKRGLLTFPLE